jgi:hypothetical protein
MNQLCWGKTEGNLLGIAQSIHKNSAWGNKNSAGEAKSGDSLGMRLHANLR